MPNAMVDPASPNATPSTSKGADSVAKALAQWYMECHQAEPGSPKCQAIMSLMQAVAEISGGPSQDPGMAEGMPEEGMPPAEGDMPMSPDMESPQEDMMEPPDAEMMEGEAGPPPTSIADAAGQTHEMMLNAAKRRKGM